MKAMIATKGRGVSLESYVVKARSALYPNAPADSKIEAYLTLEAFEAACKLDAIADQECLIADTRGVR